PDMGYGVRVDPVVSNAVEQAVKFFENWGTA
ncbi:unnamed protein product, partial [marine sediment metagenome]